MCSKANKEARLVERKVYFVLDAGNGGGEWDMGGLLSKGQLPTTDNQWARAFIDGRRGLYVETAQSTLTVILKLVTQWSDQRHLLCFKYS